MAKDRHLTAFWPQVAVDFRPEKHWLYVGRAVNRWGNKWGEPPSLGNGVVPCLQGIRDFSEELDARFPLELSPLDWMDTRWKRGQFRATVRWLNADDTTWHRGWSRGMAWSNLCKVAPWDGGNPSDDLYSAQFPACRELLRLEVEALRPELVVVLTGKDWFWDFLDERRRVSIGARIQDASTDVVLDEFFGRPAVLAPHPGQAHRAGLSPKALGEKIWNLVRSRYE